MTLRGHGSCVSYVKEFNLPMLLLGGGGYTIENVARCWTYETGVILGEDLPNDMPITDYYSKYGPEYKLHLKPANHPNCNDRKFLEELIGYNLESLKQLEPVPNIDNALPQDFIDDLNKVDKEPLVLSRKRDRLNEFDDDGRDK